MLNKFWDVLRCFEKKLKEETDRDVSQIWRFYSGMDSRKYL